MIPRHHAFCLLLLFFTVEALAQEENRTSPSYVDSLDLMTVIRGDRPPKTGDKSLADGKLMLFIVPVLGSNPTLGTFIGVGGTAAKYLGPVENTSISNLVLSLQYTTKNQFVSSIKGTIMTPGNKWEMLIDLKYRIYSYNNFGLGSDYSQPVDESWNIGGVQTTPIDGAQPMTFNDARVYFTALRSIRKNLYAGMGYHLDLHYNIKDLSLDLDAAEPVITSHYAYSSYYGFDTDAYISAGVSLDIVNDSRDNLINTYTGRFLQASYGINPQALGNQKFYQQLYLEARLFKSLSKEIPRNVLGFWTIARFTFSGQIPYLHLPASGSDMRNRIGRGYVVDRFRGTSWISSEVEYRFRITNNGLLGGVLFANMTTNSRDELVVGTTTFPKLDLFEAIRVAGGFGARITLDRQGRMNLGLDMAYGENGSKGFYLTVGETF